MNHYAAIDVSLELSSVCIVDTTGKVVKEAKVETHPEALVKFFRDTGLTFTRIGLEAGPLSQWLYEGLSAAGFEMVLMETRRVKAALSAMTVKTDRRDARHMAQLVRFGWFQPVHAKSPGSQEVRALLVARKLLQHKLTDVEMSIRGILRGFGLKVGKVTDKTFAARIRELVTGHPMLTQITDAMLAARATLLTEFSKLDKAVLAIARKDQVCRRFMTTPSVGVVVALTYKSALDDPHRLKKSKDAGPLFGLTPRRYQSGETDVIGPISKVGDEMVRTALYEAANVLLSPRTRFSALKRWGLEVAKRRGLKRAKVAVARKLAVILHRMWVDGTDFRWTNAKPAEAAA